MHQRSTPGRPRPVADPVVAALARRPEELARRWLVALLEARPLDEAPAVPVPEFVTSGPAVCAAVVAAAGSDPELDELLVSGHAAAFAQLAGGREGPAVVTAAEALRRSISEAAAEEIPRAATDVFAALSDRLAHVCAQLAATAMSTSQAAARRAADRLEEEPPDDGPAPPLELAAARGELREDSAPLWVAALERQLSEGGRFGLLLVELDGADRLALAEGEEGARELFGEAGRAVRGALRRSDLLAHEQDGRLWVIAPDAGRQGAVALAERVAAAVEAAASPRGAPLTASVGLALYPDDGRDAATLTAEAEESALAARAAGVRVAGGPGGRPAARGPRLVP